MERNHWPVTFSIGVLTCENPSLTADELIRRADKLMYSVKNNGKNAIAYGVYAGEPAEGSSSTTPQTDGSS
jgi:PleD family two-component response regulator